MIPTAWGLLAATGCVTSVYWLERHRRGMSLSENEFWVAMWSLVAGGIIGAKALFVLLGWEHYARGEMHFWEDFGTGFVFFGGLAGALIAGVLFARVRRLPFARGADHFAVAVPLGHAIGRVGCFIEGCCGGVAGQPVQLYEATGLLGIAWLGSRALARVQQGDAVDGTAFRLYLASYALLRFLLDPLRADGRPERYLDLSYPQYMALAMVLVALLWQGHARREAISGSSG